MQTPRNENRGLMETPAACVPPNLDPAIPAGSLCIAGYAKVKASSDHLKQPDRITWKLAGNAIEAPSDA